MAVWKGIILVNNSKNDNKINTKCNVFGIILTSVLILSVLPYFIISVFSRPSADDYTYSIGTHQLVCSEKWNLFSLIKAAFAVDMEFYNNWQGLYSSAFVLSLQPGIFGEEFYFIGAWALMALLFLSIWFLANNLVHGLLGGGIKKRYVALFSFFVFAVLIQGMPSMLQGIYWFNGAWNYTFFFCLVLLNVGLLIGYIFRGGGKCRLVLLTLLSFIISGGNHVTAFLNILLLVIVGALMFKRKKELLIPLSMAIIGYIIVFVAPGTMVRQGEEARQGIISTLAHCVWWLFKYLCDWIDVQFVFLMILLIPVAYLLSCRCNIDFNIFKIHPIFMVLGEMMLICGMLCVPFMAMGNLGSDRLKNVIWLTFMICSAINWMYLMLWSKVFLLFQNVKFNGIYALCIFCSCIIVCFFTDSNIYMTVGELVNGKAVEYANACDERYELMEQSPIGTIIYVGELPDSKMLKFSDLSADTEFWTNAAWGDYYSVDVIVEYENE